MEAIRCIDCGDVRWSLMGLAKTGPGKCEMCGGEMVRERRHPERGPMWLGAERRDAAGRMTTPRSVGAPR
jgi:hypothetical protein